MITRKYTAIGFLILLCLIIWIFQYQTKQSLSERGVSEMNRLVIVLSIQEKISIFYKKCGRFPSESEGLLVLTSAGDSSCFDSRQEGLSSPAATNAIKNDIAYSSTEHAYKI